MKKSLALAIGLAFSATAALAEDRAIPGAETASPDVMGHPSTQYQSLDTNGDGFISESEAKANGAIKFDELDADRDGRLSMQELAGAQRKNAGATDQASRSGATSQESGAGEMGDKTSLFNKLDHDRDGYLSAEELQVSADLKLKLEHIDADGDGKVSREEFLTAFEEGPADEAGAAGRGGSSTQPPD